MNHPNRFAVSLACLMLSLATTAEAQIIPDDTVDSQANSDDNLNYQIDGGTTRGGNLFHSFEQFSVPEGGSANFNNNSAIERIFSRVTGADTSRIDGIISIQGSADLFLINPNGIIFGPNAQLNLGGSFFGTTAAEVVFQDGTRFSATNPTNSPLLTISVPIGLQFNQTAAPIINQSSRPGKSLTLDSIPFPLTLQGLYVDPNQTIALIGGNIQFEQGSFIFASGANTEVGSVAPTSLVQINQDVNQNWQVDYNQVNQFQDINLITSNILAVGDRGGSIRLQARNISLTGGSQVGTGSFSNQPPGNVIFNATDAITISGFIDTDRSSGIANTALANADGGSIIINTSQLILDDTGSISTSSAGVIDNGTELLAIGNGGQIIINADNIQITGDRSDIESTTFTSGRGGDINITTNTLTLLDGGKINTQAEENATGDAGTITLDIADTLTVDGEGSAILSDATNSMAGNITITSPQINLSDNGAISVSSEGTGGGGNLFITSDLLTVEDSEISASAVQLQTNSDSPDTNNGGNIILNIDDTLLLDDGTISARASNFGDGGNVNIDAEVIVGFGEDNQILADAEGGRGGNLNITTTDIIGNVELDASSQENVDGVINIRQFNINQQGIVELNTDELDAESQLVAGCIGIDDEDVSEFYIIGKGGFAANPNDLLDGEEVYRPWIDLSQVETSLYPELESYQPPQPTAPIVEAQGMVVTPEGRIFLTATGAAATNPSNWYAAGFCAQTYSQR